MNTLIIYCIRNTVHITVTFLLMTNVIRKHYRVFFCFFLAYLTKMYHQHRLQGV